jgi:hypothetical protein
VLPENRTISPFMPEDPRAHGNARVTTKKHLPTDRSGENEPRLTPDGYGYRVLVGHQLRNEDSLGSFGSQQIMVNREVSLDGKRVFLNGSGGGGGSGTSTE